MKIFLKYLFVVLGIFLSNQINACDFGKKSEVQSSSNLYCGFPVLDIRIKNKSDVLTVIGEVKALRAERLLAIAEKEAFYTDDIAQVYTKLKGKNIDEAIDVLDDLNKAANAGGKWLDDLESLLGAGSKTKIQGWLDEGLDATKVEQAFTNATDKANLFNKLDNAKSIQHQRVLTNDLDNIPGVSKGQFSENGLTSAKTKQSWNDSELDLPLREAENFVNAIGEELPAGTKIYRVTGGNPAGGYWTIQKPNSVGDVIGGTAVRPEWNSFEKIYVYEVPQGQTLKVWKGTTAKQQVADDIFDYYLPGGKEQIFIPQKLRNKSFSNSVNEIALPW